MIHISINYNSMDMCPIHKNSTIKHAKLEQVTRWLTAWEVYLIGSVSFVGNSLLGWVTFVGRGVVHSYERV